MGLLNAKNVTLIERFHSVGLLIVLSIQIPKFGNYGTDFIKWSHFYRKTGKKNSKFRNNGNMIFVFNITILIFCNNILLRNLKYKLNNFTNVFSTV